MPGFNINDYDPAYVMEILKGIEGAEMSVFLKFFQSEGVTGDSGKIPFFPSKYTLLSDAEETKIAANDEPDTYAVETNSVEFKFDGKYAKEGTVHEKTLMTMGGQIKDETSLISYLAKVARMKIAAAFDLDAANVLKSTTLNDTYSVAQPWDGSGTDPTILDDIYNMVDAAGDPDFCWLGKDIMRLLQQDEAFHQAAGANFSSTNGWIPKPEVVNILMKHFEFEDVIVDGTWYNTANEAQAISKARIFDGFFTVGHRDHMVVPSLDELEKANSWSDDRSGNHGVWAQQYLDIARAEQERIVTATDLTA